METTTPLNPQLQFVIGMLSDFSPIKFYKKYVSLHTSREEAEASLLALLKIKCDLYWDYKNVKMAKRRAEKRREIHEYNMQYNVYQEHDIYSTIITKLAGEKRKYVIGEDETSPKRRLSELDAEERFENIIYDTTVEINLPKDIKEYLRDLLSGDIKSALLKVKEPLNENARPLLLWANEVCRHFIFYFHYDGLQTNSDEKTWSNQTVYRILDLFSMFFGNLTSGIALGDKNDAVLYQDENATVVYEQSFGPKEFDSTQYMEDITKLARNGIDDLNYHFLQYGKSSVTTAKKLKSIGIHGYEYYVSIYLMDLICKKLYRIYEIFNCKIPTSYTDRWLLTNIVMIGVYLEALLVERQSVKVKMCEEDMIPVDGPYCVRDWMSVPDNTPETKRTSYSQNQ
ncbi:1149_t:CDS:2 [Acaulospora morrowiae]|uniref:1149_t:CDS:1 n=1 Tax=Acaulospora morrowiae TaxID=94023 RepID=A0A9N9HN60_9GLOM|nr:1149_t:CDS:2 [Acaulospora morrowiae]